VLPFHCFCHGFCILNHCAVFGGHHTVVTVTVTDGHNLDRSQFDSFVEAARSDEIVEREISTSISSSEEMVTCPQHVLQCKCESPQYSHLASLEIDSEIIQPGASCTGSNIIVQVTDRDLEDVYVEEIEREYQIDVNSVCFRNGVVGTLKTVGIQPYCMALVAHSEYADYSSLEKIILTIPAAIETAALVAGGAYAGSVALPAAGTFVSEVTTSLYVSGSVYIATPVVQVASGVGATVLGTQVGQGALNVYDNPAVQQFVGTALGIAKGIAVAKAQETSGLTAADLNIIKSFADTTFDNFLPDTAGRTVQLVDDINNSLSSEDHQLLPDNQISPILFSPFDPGVYVFLIEDTSQ